MMSRTYRYKTGFTLTELLVVISIVAILSAVTWVNYSQSSAKSRDSKRQSDLKMLQTAIETYKKDNGRYPYQATTTNASAAGWSGQKGTIYQPDDGSGEYIVGLAPTYIPVLPKDPKLNGSDSGYVYRTNAEGTVYKIKAQRTVEADTISINHAFKPCDIKVPHTSVGTGLAIGGPTATNPQVVGWCGRMYNYNGNGNTYGLPTTCYSSTEGWSKSYALWGGLAPLKSTVIAPGSAASFATDPLGDLGAPTDSTANQRRAQAVQDTTAVICK